MRRDCFIITVNILAVVVFILSGSAAAGSDPPLEAILFQQKKMTGDFDKMIEHRTIRALVVPSKTFYFIDKGKQYGISYEALREFEKYINRKLNRKTLKVHVVFIPVSRDELIPSLVNGLGDIAVANLTITAERRKLVDFSDPVASGVEELLVTSKEAPPINSMDDLAGKEICLG